MVNSFGRGPSCVTCDWNRRHAEVGRWFDTDRLEWRYERRCAWCGSVFPATLAEYEAQENEEA